MALCTSAASGCRVMMMRAVSMTARPLQLVPGRPGFHTDARPHHNQDITQWFCEILSAEPHPPADRVNTYMNLISSHSPQSTAAFNLPFRTTSDRWSIKGLRITADKERDIKDSKGVGSAPPGKSVSDRNKHVVLVSGTNARERATVRVGLYVAAVLSRRPVPGVDVSVIPLAYPKEYELYWRAEQALSSASPLHSHSLMPSGMRIPSPSVTPERDFCSAGPIRNYVMRSGRYHINYTMDLGQSASLLKHRNETLSPSYRRAEYLLSNYRDEMGTAMGSSEGGIGSCGYPSGFAIPGGDTPLMSPFLSTPTYVIEVRDRNLSVDEDHISAKGDEVLSAIQMLTGVNLANRDL